MITMPRITARTLAVVVAGLLLVAGAGAEQKAVFGDLEVHYIVLNTTALAPEMLAPHDITRAPNRALVNVSGRRLEPDGSTEPADIDVAGRATNLVGQPKRLVFEEVREPGAAYHLATLTFTDRDTVRFELTITDRQTGRSHPLAFQKQLWRD